MQNLKNKHEILVVATVLCAAFLFSYSFFHAGNKTLTRQIRIKGSEYQELKSLLLKKEEIKSAYSQLAAGASGDLVRYVTEISKAENVNIESIYPKAAGSSGSAADEFRYLLKFKAAPESLAGFLYRVSSTDPLYKIDGIGLNKTNDGFLACEVNLSRVTPK